MPDKWAHIRKRRRPGTDWSLRIGLGFAFAGLIITATVVSSGGAPAQKPSPRSTTTTTSPSGSGGTQRGSSTTTTIPGAFTGKVRTKEVGHGCRFALADLTSKRTGAAPTSAGLRPVGHCTVLEIGDSLGNDLGWGLERHLAATAGVHFVQLDKPSTGLANAWYYNWPNHLAVDLAAYHPQVVLVFLGGNDQQGMTIDGSAVQFAQPKWDSTYVGFVRRVVDEVTSTGAYLLWIGLPIMQPPSYNQGASLLDSLYQKGVTSQSDATFVSTWSLFSDPAGQFATQAAVNGVETTLREPDGIHFSFSGEDVLATYVIREMARIYHVSLVATSPAVISHWG